MSRAMSPTAGVLDPVAREFYRDVMARLEISRGPLGGTQVRLEVPAR